LRKLINMNGIENKPVKDVEYEEKWWNSWIIRQSTFRVT
jgi:hypothetical protein